MFNENDIYSHFMKGGSPEDLHKALEIEIKNAQHRIAQEQEAEKKEKELAEQEAKARSAAFKALKFYLALANPDITDDIIDLTLDTLKTVSKVKVDIFDDNAAIPLTRFFR